MSATTTGDSSANSKRTLRYPGLLGLFLLASLTGVLSYTRYFIFAPVSEATRHYWPGVLLWMSCFYPWVLLAPLVFRLEKRFPIGSARWPSSLSLLALGGLASVYAAFQLSVVFAAAFQLLIGAPVSALKPFWSIPFDEFWAHSLLYVGAVALAYIARKLIQLQTRERQSAALALEKSQLESSLRHVELDVLRMRLNPHFLFNTLQNIAVLTQHEPRTAGQMLVRLGDLLRAAFRRDAQPEVSLAAEMALTQSYLEVEKMRFQDRLSVQIEIEPGTEEALVPTLLLQPLVENAMKHGLRGSQTVGKILISSKKSAHSLLLCVVDNGVGLSAGDRKHLKLGVGLGSTAERLALLYPGSHEFRVQDAPGGGVQVTVSFPFRSALLPIPSIASHHDQPASAHC